jgi:DNA-binding response OmpR family regulator
VIRYELTNSDLQLADRTIVAGEAAQDLPVQFLVVSDDPRLREEARYAFPAGVDVVLATDAREAWRLLRTGTPSAVIIDIQTGSAGGYGLRRDMSQDPRLQEVPTLMLLERIQDAWLAREAGATAYLTKPVDAGELVAESLALLSTS